MRAPDRAGRRLWGRGSRPGDPFTERCLGGEDDREFNQARDEEYEEVVDEAERFREEIDRERRNGKYTFAELEDEETNLERLHEYLGQVEVRDSFGASGRSRAAAEVATCDEVLQVFVQEIYERQAGSVDGSLPEPDRLSRWLVEERE